MQLGGSSSLKDVNDFMDVIVVVVDLEPFNWCATVKVYSLIVASAE
jgi:hypothetical protein